VIFEVLSPSTEIYDRVEIDEAEEIETEEK